MEPRLRQLVLTSPQTAILEAELRLAHWPEPALSGEQLRYSIDLPDDVANLELIALLSRTADDLFVGSTATAFPDATDAPFVGFRQIEKLIESVGFVTLDEGRRYQYFKYAHGRPALPATPIFANIPDELRRERRWINWAWYRREGDDDYTKTPRTGSRWASSTDPTTWVTFEEAVGYYENCIAVPSPLCGIGFVLGDNWGGFDLDECRPDGQFENWSIQIGNAFARGAYMEISPSGRGVKGILRSPEGPGRKQTLSDEQLDRWGLAPRPAGSKQRAIEVYSRARFFTITARLACPAPPRLLEMPDELTWLYETYFPAPRPAPAVTSGGTLVSPVTVDGALAYRIRQYLNALPLAVSGDGGHPATFRAACALVIDFNLSREDALPFLAEWNEHHCHPPWGQPDLEYKIESAGEKKSDPANSARIGRLLRDAKQRRQSYYDDDPAPRRRRR